MQANNIDINKITQMGPAYFDNPELYRRTSKKKYEVYVCMPKIGQAVHNKLENANYITEEGKRFVISGTVGEQWVISIDKLAKTYQLPDGAEINPAYLKTKIQQVNGNSIIDWFTVVTKPGGGGINWATFVPKQFIFKIKTSWGDVLTVNDPSVDHGNGDFLVCSDGNGIADLSDRWVVNGKVFITTYDMRHFPRFGTSKAMEAPRPTSILNLM